jgi:uncharacterized protein YbaP (TraB family)
MSSKKRKTILKRVLAFLAALCCAGCPVANELPLITACVSKGDKRATLVASLHTGLGAAQLSDKAKARVTEVGTLVVFEARPNDPFRTAERDIQPEDASKRVELPKELMARMRSRLEQMGSTPADLDRFEKHPLGAAAQALVFQGTWLKLHGDTPARGPGLEGLVVQAVGNTRRITGLSEYRLRDDAAAVSLQQAASGLVQSVLTQWDCAACANKLIDLTAKKRAAYLVGDLAVYESHERQYRAAHPSLRFYELFNDARSVAMADQLDRLLGDSGRTDHFVLVGVAHFAGPSALPDVLLKRGFSKCSSH